MKLLIWVIYGFIILGFLVSGCSREEGRIEVQLTECISQSLNGKEKQLKASILEQEKLLIEENFLIDNSGESYRQMLLEVAYGDEDRKAPSKFFFDELKGLDGGYLKLHSSCYKTLTNNLSLYDQSKLQELDESIAMVEPEDINVAEIVEVILNVLSEKEFELDYYKVRAFLVLEIYHSDIDTGLIREISDSEDNELEFDLANAMNVYLNESNQVFVDEEMVSLEKLRESVRRHTIRNRAESVILMKAELETMYKTYYDVQNAIVDEIDSLRSEFAEDKFNMSIDKLTSKQLEVVKNTYPVRVLDKDSISPL